MSPLPPSLVLPSSLGLPAAPAAGDGRAPDKVRDAAQQFEALLIGQMLRAVRESGGWLPG